MNQRLPWADNAKALGMLLVFWGHFIEAGAFSGHSLLHDVYKGIYAFHMPLFFLLAGFFFHPKQQLRFGCFFVQKIKTRLVPVLFFVALIMPFWLWQVPGLAHDPGQLAQSWLLLQGKPTANWTCWFLICLFVVELLASEIIPGVTKRLSLFVLLLLLYWFAYRVTENAAQTASLIGFAENWWFLQESMMALFFYLTGHMLSHYSQSLVPAKTSRRGLLFFICTVLLLATFNLNFTDGLGAVNMSGANHGHWLWFPVTALIGSLSIIYLGSLLPGNRLLSLIGENTLPLLGFAGFFLHLFNQPLWALVSTINNEVLLLLVCLMVAMLSILVCLPFAYLLNRYLPFLVGRWK